MMQTRRSSLRFKHFSRKGYALFSVLGREVLVGTLTVATLTHAKAEGVSVDKERADDTMQRQELRLDEVVVTGSRTPLTQSEAAKIVSVITREEIQRAAAETVNDVLKLATGVDVRQRGGFGVQTDISIGGGTFDQIAILLNGVNISNPQTGHLSADFPVSLDDIQRIEIVQGAAARVFGASAFNGVINIVTSPSGSFCAADAERKAPVLVGVEGGSYGTFGGTARVAFPSCCKGRGSVSMSYRQSDGGTSNSYFRQSQGFYQSRASLDGLVRKLFPSLEDCSGELSWQFGLSTKRYGANTFYSAAYPNQYESNARLFASIGADLHLGLLQLRIQPYWNRNYDHFQLIRNTAIGENFHRNDVFGASANLSAEWQLGRSSFGAEIRKEIIYSTNLGSPLDEDDFVSVPRHDGIYYNKRCKRTDFNLFLEHNVLLRNFTASLGIVANRNTGYSSDYRFYPGIDLSYRPADKWKLTASWNMAFRMPTFTDLFYKSPTQQGNVGLKPERTQSLRFAADYDAPAYSLRASFFYDHGTDMIDWVMYSAEDVYHSANFRLNNYGAELNATFRPCAVWLNSPVTEIKLNYAYITQTRHDDTYVFKSNYAMEYLRHKFIASIDHRIVSRLSASWSFRWQQRMGSYMVYENAKSTGEIRPYHPYGILDLKLRWTAPHYSLSLSLNNLTSYRYYDLGNVLQPGFWLMAGAKFTF